MATTGRLKQSILKDVDLRNIVLAGGGSKLPGLAAALEKTLAELGGGRVRAVEDPVFAGSNGSLAIALDAPEGDWEPLSA